MSVTMSEPTTDTDWQPVAYVSATHSKEPFTTVQVVNTDDGVYLAATHLEGDSIDTCMTDDEAVELAYALLAAVQIRRGSCPSKSLNSAALQ